MFPLTEQTCPNQIHNIFFFSFSSAPMSQKQWGMVQQDSCGIST